MRQFIFKSSLTRFHLKPILSIPRFYSKSKDFDGEKKKHILTEIPHQIDYKNLTDGEILDLLTSRKLAQHKLEELFGDMTRAVKLRRMYSISRSGSEKDSLDGLPYEHFDYEKVYGVCCESVIGYVPLPVGIIGPLRIDGKDYNIPLATVEGCLIASAQRGCNALNSRGVNSVITNDGMTRGPVVAMPDAKRAGELKKWISDNYQQVEKEFNSTSNFARLKGIKVAIAGRKAFLRFACVTGDAMGMNMITKAVTKAMVLIGDVFPDMNVISVSGNYCTDKKPSAINWIEGRGKSVVVDSFVPQEIVKSVLKTTVDDLVSLTINKTYIGSAMAGSIGGFNAHASNLVTAVFLATGQDAAQNVESSNCITIMEKTEDGDLYISCTMPSIEVGTVGGGTHLAAQSACLDIIGVKGAHPVHPGQNAQTLARVVASAVMAGELSLMSALASGDLLKSHMKLNRKK
jgi:hydroxymethylglutaryl-CoA reductase (NADPH)